MSIGPMNPLTASIVGSSFATNRASEIDRDQQDVTSQNARLQGVEKAEMAAGIGQTDGEDHETADRDADGRRPWKFRAADAKSQHDDEADSHLSKDPSGQCGNELDLSG